MRRMVNAKKRARVVFEHFGFILSEVIYICP
jgi:hypothetical protein